MSRSTIAFDRVMTFLVAVLLIALGAGAIAWWLDVFSWLPRSLDTSGAQAEAGRWWWPWAVGAVGLLLIVAGLRWMVAHVPDRAVGNLTLPGSGSGGKLRAVPSSVAHAAAQELAETPGVRTATGKVLRERGQLVARLTATIEADADLHAIAAAADQVAADLGTVLAQGDLRCQVRLAVRTRARALPRVA